MRRLLFSTGIASMLFLAACGGGNADKANTSEQQKVAATTGQEYTIADSSMVKWRATHKGGLNPRYGTLHIASGNIFADSGVVTGGNFVVDINSLTVDTASVTEPGKKASDLETHLKSPDFFDVVKYPAAKFEITKIAAFDSTKDQSTVPGANNIVSGNLTIKDSTINITFPAKITVTNSDVHIVASFNVDRTTWGLNYGTKGSAADWIISKDFQINIDLEAKAK